MEEGGGNEEGDDGDELGARVEGVNEAGARGPGGALGEHGILDKAGRVMQRALDETEAAGLPDGARRG